MSAERIYKVLGRTLWRAMLVLVVVLAVYVAGARALLSALPAYQENIDAWVSERIGHSYQIYSLRGDINKF